MAKGLRETSKIDVLHEQFGTGIATIK